MPAAPRRERDDGGNVLRIFAGQRQRAPGAGRMADHDHALGADEGLLAQKAGGGGDLIRRDAARSGVISLVAAALIFEVFSARRAMARTLGDQHGKTARHQPGGERTVFGLRHLRPSQHVLGGGVRDHGKRKRPLAGRPKQHRMRRGDGIGRRYQPLLQPVRLALRTLRAKGGLRGCGLHTERGNENQRKKQVWRMHERA